MESFPGALIRAAARAELPKTVQFSTVEHIHTTDELAREQTQSSVTPKL